MIMSLNRMVLGGLCVAGMVAALGTAARADNINTSGVACKNFNASEALDIEYVDTGVRNVNASPRSIICPVPRSPLSSIPAPEFYVDGTNNPGTSTTCTATLYDFQGNRVAIVSFTEGATSPWDHSVTFGIAPSFYDYVSVRCLLPGSSAGEILGVTAVQP